MSLTAPRQGADRDLHRDGQERQPSGAVRARVDFLHDGRPTTDYGYTSFGSNVSTPGYVTESASGATCANGTCTYHLTHTLPSSASGTYAIGAEARRTDTIPVLTGGQTVQTAIEYGAPNVVSYFSVDGSPVTPRREVVQLSNCNGCHNGLSVHGSLRNNTEYLCDVPQSVEQRCFASRDRSVALQRTTRSGD